MTREILADIIALNSGAFGLSLSSSNPSTSPSLLARVRNDDSQAWQELVDLYGPLIAGWCRRKGLRGPDGADVLQSVFMSVARGLLKWQPADGRDGSFRAWLWMITRNRIVDYWRSQPNVIAAGGSSNQRRVYQAPDRLSESISLDDPEPTFAEDLSELTSRALAMVQRQVAPQTWQAFWRTVIDGVPTHQAASELNLSVASIRQARSRVLRRLREQLGDC